jgi:two-component sensor histidine kinase
VLKRRAETEMGRRAALGWSIKAYLTVLALCSVFPIAILASYLAYRLVSQSTQNTRFEVENTLRLLRSGIDLRIANVVEDLEVLALSPALQNGDFAVFLQHASQVEKLIGGTGLILGDRDGQIIASTVKAEPTHDHRRDIGTSTLVFDTGKPQVSGLRDAPPDGRRFITVEVPVRVGGEIRYVLALGLSPQYLAAVMDEYVPQRMVGAIIDSHGILISRWPGDEFIGQRVNSGILAHLNKPEALWLKSTLRSGVPAYSSLLRSEQTGWIVDLTLPREEVDGPFHKTLAFFAVITLLAIIASIAFARRISEHFLSALTGFQHQVMRLRTASLPHPQPGPVAEINIMESVVESAMNRQQILIDEINHRVKNTLATVQSIARLSLTGATTLQDYAKSFDERLIALAAAYDLLTANNWEGAELKAIIERTLAPFAGDERVGMTGPHVLLNPKVALAMSAAIQELSTNAAKYGSLSARTGRLDISWFHHSDKGGLSFNWAERGGPLVQKPNRRGFGTRLIEDILAAESGWSVSLSYPPDGLRCAITVPASQF